MVICAGVEPPPLPPPRCGEDGTELFPTGFLQFANNNTANNISLGICFISLNYLHNFKVNSHRLVTVNNSEFLLKCQAKENSLRDNSGIKG